MNTSAKLRLLAPLYFSQGLPFGFFVQALPVLLWQQGFSLGEIGLTSLLALPWALKFLWAPAVDRWWIAGVGRRRSWIVPLQLASVAILLVLALSGSGSTTLLMSAVLLLNLVAATQDIATDGLAVDLLSPRERGLGSGLQVAGYRVGMIVGGGALLVLHDELGSSATFVAMAAVTALATLPIAGACEPAMAERPRALALPHFLWRPGALRILSIVVVYKAGEAFATGMLRPFLAEAGLGLADIGWLVGTVGFGAGLAGALAGGILVGRIGRRRALVGFGLLQAATVAGWAAIAFATPTRSALWILCGAEHFAGGMATAALFACMMDWCSRETSATDYTVQASAVVLATGVASALSGFSAQALGWPGHFVLATALALAGLFATFRLFPTGSRGETTCFHPSFRSCSPRSWWRSSPWRPRARSSSRSPTSGCCASATAS